jgi:hypothetical protein
MGKSVRDFFFLVAVLCLSVASEAGIFEKVSRYLTHETKLLKKKNKKKGR